MRIAFVSLMTASQWGASEVLWMKAAQRAVDNRDQVYVSVSGWPELRTELQSLREVGSRLDLRTRNRLIRRSALLARAAGVFNGLKRFRPDVICINQGGTYDLARSGSTAELRRILLSLNVPMVILCHCEQAHPQRHAPCVRSLFQRASIVGFTAERAQYVAEGHLEISLANARVFQNPVNLDRVERLAWPADDQLRFAYVGRLEAVKNLHVLIESLARAEWKSRNWNLSFFGTGSLSDDLKRRVAQGGLEHRVSFEGHVSDVASIWRRHHVLLLPSLREGVPSAMIEAMLCGRPVVATQTGGIPEWIEDGRNGFLISTPDETSIVETLERLWIQRDQLREMGDYAYSSTILKRDPAPADTLIKWLQEVAPSSSSIIDNSIRSGIEQTL